MTPRLVADDQTYVSFGGTTVLLIVVILLLAVLVALTFRRR